VNYVGVDVNTASAPLLAFISGMNKSLGQQLVKYREENGPFVSRDQFRKVPSFTQKVFQQCAGFLRIYGGKNPLDATFIHPEQYPHLNQWVQKNNISISELKEKPDYTHKLETDVELVEKIGALTIKDMVISLMAPSQDPRKVFQATDFSQDLRTLEDVKMNQQVKGIVTNITNFGAFVDIGIKEQGLIHISELGHSFVENTFDVLQVGQEISVKVIGVDLERRRLGLSLKNDVKPQQNQNQGAPRTLPPKNKSLQPSPKPLVSAPKKAPVVAAAPQPKLPLPPKPIHPLTLQEQKNSQKKNQNSKPMANRPFANMLKNLKLNE
jgi:uncharacterized protein